MICHSSLCTTAGLRCSVVRTLQASSNVVRKNANGKFSLALRAVSLYPDPGIRLAWMYTLRCIWKSLQVCASGDLSLISTGYLLRFAQNACAHCDHTLSSNHAKVYLKQLSKWVKCSFSLWYIYRLHLGSRTRLKQNWFSSSLLKIICYNSVPILVLFCEKLRNPLSLS